MGHLQLLPNTGLKGPHGREKYFLEIRNRNRWLLDSGGERVLLLKRRFEGERCVNFDQVRKSSQQHGQDLICYGTGFTGGYFKPIEIVVSLISGAPEDVTIQEYGRKRSFKSSSWTLWEPLLTVGDILIRKNNQRLEVTTVTLRRWKSYILHQDFTYNEVERNHPIYSLPL